MLKTKGFTLIELLIVIVVIGIISSVALPSYQSYTRKANRSDGLEYLHNLLNAQERYYADNMEYADKLTKLGAANDTMLTPRGRYSVTVSACGSLSMSRCAEIYATAQGDQAKDGDLIFTTSGKQVRKLSGTEYDL